MKIIAEIDKMRTYAKIMKKNNKMVGFVPTMGALHGGHAALIQAARKQVDIVIVSIFVNPVQFGPNEDYGKYPRNIKADEELVRSAGADVIFYPKKEDVYPEGYSTYVGVEGITERLCGKSRPGHFRGVTTVIAKFFEIIKPDIAYFGLKDAQQAFVIKKMIKDLNMDITLKIMPTVREADGLAMSSRNAYLSPAERRDAAFLNKALETARESVLSGERNSKKIIKIIREIISKATSARIDYVSVVDTVSFKDMARVKNGALIALAVYIGKTRLIDNLVVDITGKASDGEKKGKRRAVQARA